MATTKPTSTCAQCGTSFTPRNRGNDPRPPQRFCSPPCKHRAACVPYLVRIARHLKTFADPDTCWLWTGRVNIHGYGLLKVTRAKNVYAHRAAWEALHGPIPKGLNVLHRCDRPSCINAVNHLFLGTRADNVADMITKGRMPRGERRGHAKLTNEQIREIRAASGSHQALATRFRVSASMISMIRKRRKWAHVV